MCGRLGNANGFRVARPRAGSGSSRRASAAAHAVRRLVYHHPPGPQAEERFQPVGITPLQRSQDVPAGIAVAVEDDPLEPDLPLLSWSADRVGDLCFRLKLVSEDLQHNEVISHDNHALGTAHAFADVTSKTDLANRRASSEHLHSGRSGVAESTIQPLLRDQCLAGQFGTLRQNVRAIPGAVLAGLAAHGFQPDLVCKSHWIAGKVGVRAHGARDHEMFARDLGWSVFQCVAIPLVAQKSEMAVSLVTQQLGGRVTEHPPGGWLGP